MLDRPGHVFVDRAGMSHVRQLLDSGVKASTYDNGFIHARTILIDACAAPVVGADRGVRSFRLDFETNAVIYDAGITRRLEERFIQDLDVCSPIKYRRLDTLPPTKRVRRSTARLFSPML